MIEDLTARPDIFETIRSRAGGWTVRQIQEDTGRTPAEIIAVMCDLERAGLVVLGTKGWREARTPKARPRVTRVHTPRRPGVALCGALLHEPAPPGALPCGVCTRAARRPHTAREVGEAMAGLRTALGATLADVAGAGGVRPDTVRDAESGMVRAFPGVARGLAALVVKFGGSDAA